MVWTKPEVEGSGTGGPCTGLNRFDRRFLKTRKLQTHLPKKVPEPVVVFVEFPTSMPAPRGVEAGSGSLSDFSKKTIGKRVDRPGLG